MLLLPYRLKNWCIRTYECRHLIPGNIQPIIFNFRNFVLICEQFIIPKSQLKIQTEHLDNYLIIEKHKLKQIIQTTTPRQEFFTVSQANKTSSQINRAEVLRSLMKMLKNITAPPHLLSFYFP